MTPDGSPRNHVLAHTVLEALCESHSAYMLRYKAHEGRQPKRRSAYASREAARMALSTDFHGYKSDAGGLRTICLDKGRKLDRNEVCPCWWLLWVRAAQIALHATHCHFEYPHCSLRIL